MLFMITSFITPSLASNISIQVIIEVQWTISSSQWETGFLSWVTTWNEKPQYYTIRAFTFNLKINLFKFHNVFLHRHLNSGFYLSEYVWFDSVFNLCWGGECSGKLLVHAAAVCNERPPLIHQSQQWKQFYLPSNFLWCFEGKNKICTFK